MLQFKKVSRTRTIYSIETYTTCRPDITLLVDWGKKKQKKNNNQKTRYLLTRKQCAIVYTVITEYYRANIRQLVSMNVLVYARACVSVYVRYRSGENNYVLGYIYACICWFL